jgi:hypothetical protein
MAAAAWVMRSWPGEACSGGSVRRDGVATCWSPWLVRRAGAEVLLPQGQSRAPVSVDHRGDDRRAVGPGRAFTAVD